MKVGDKVLILPDLTNHNYWLSGKIIEIEHVVNYVNH